jgi:truncated hemoglobin YjbI
MAEMLFQELGGRETLKRVHVLFYEKLLKDPWLKDLFVGIPRAHLEDQQTDFMQYLFGGPNIYEGRMPKRGHQHLFVTEEIFMERSRILAETLDECGISADHKERWLRYDTGLKMALVKRDINQCEGRYRTEKIISVNKPPGR